MNGPSFKATAEDRKIARKIGQRARDIDVDVNRSDAALSAQDWEMYVVACHANGCPLRLEDLAAADDFDFVHDVFGIARHMDQTTGQLTGCFRPRYAT